MSVSGLPKMLMLFSVCCYLSGVSIEEIKCVQWFNGKQGCLKMQKWVYSNMAWFKTKLQQFLKWDSYSIKMQINNVFFSLFLPSSQTFQPSYKIILNYIRSCHYQDMIFFFYSEIYQQILKVSPSFYYVQQGPGQIKFKDHFVLLFLLQINRGDSQKNQKLLESKK